MKTLNLKPNLLRALTELNFTEPMEIQTKTIPEILKGKDVFGHSSTGSGKTAAFGLPIIEMLTPKQGVQALVLTPTRELCVQVSNALKSFAKYMDIRITSVYGGVGIEPQIENIRYSDIIVGTPGRILDHLNRRTLTLNKVRFLVLDEADKMFEMGFIDDVNRIISFTPKSRQTLLFSATIPSAVHALIKTTLKNPLIIKSKSHVDKTFLKQVYYVVNKNEKFSLLTHLLKTHSEGFSMVFCATRRETDSIAKNLFDNGVHAMAIHGGLTQNRRQYALDSLKNKKIKVLVCTDVAARGLDIREISHVYNYDVPKTSDEYIHRIGRTARAGDNGDAITLLSERDYESFNRILANRNLEIRKECVPVFPKVTFNSGKKPYFERSSQDQNRSGGHRFNSNNRRGGFRSRDNDSRSRNPDVLTRKRYNA